MGVARGGDSPAGGGYPTRIRSGASSPPGKMTARMPRLLASGKLRRVTRWRDRPVEVNGELSEEEM